MPSTTQSLKSDFTESVQALDSDTLLIFPGLQGLSFSFLLHFGLFELGKRNKSACILPVLRKLNEELFPIWIYPKYFVMHIEISLLKGQRDSFLNLGWEVCISGTAFLFALDPVTNTSEQNLLFLLNWLRGGLGNMCWDKWQETRGGKMWRVV